MMPMYSHVSTTLHFSRNYKRTLPPSPPCSFAIIPRRIQFPLRSLCVQHITQLAHTERHDEEYVRVIFLTCASLTLADHQQWRYCWQAVCDTALRLTLAAAAAERRRDEMRAASIKNEGSPSLVRCPATLHCSCDQLQRHRTPRIVPSWWAWW